MRISTVTEPVGEVRFLNAGRGQGDFYTDRLPIHRAAAAALPDHLDAIIATADLQGRELFGHADAGPPRLLGEVLPEILCRDFLPQFGVAPDRAGVILAGDFYTVPALDRRGGSGDVTSVWQSFARTFKWIVGVAGNHDTFGDTLAPKHHPAPHATYLDCTHADVDGLTIAGIGGIIGNPRKPHRKNDQTYGDAIRELSCYQPQILVLHDGPAGSDTGQRGSPIIRHSLEKYDPCLVVRGHSHWDDPFAELDNGTQVLNVDCRVVVIQRSVEPAGDAIRHDS